MAGKFRCEQRHRDGTGLQHRKEGGDIVQTLGSHDRDPVSPGNGLLDQGPDRPHPDIELAPGEFGGVTFGPGEVEEAIRHGVADVDDVAFDQRNQRRARR